MLYLYTRTATCSEADEDQPDQEASEGAEVAALPWQSDLMMMGFTVVIQPEQKSIIRAQNKTKNRKYSARSSPDLVACYWVLLVDPGFQSFQFDQSAALIYSLHGTVPFPCCTFGACCLLSAILKCQMLAPATPLQMHLPDILSPRPHAHYHTPINSRGNLPQK